MILGGADRGVPTPFPIVAFVVLLAILSVVGLVTRRSRLPYSVVLVLVGVAVSAAAPEVHVQITPQLVLATLLPGLVFEAAFRIDVRRLFRALAGVALLAVPGVLITAALVAVVLYVATGLPLGLGLVVGAMISATDPAAVIDAVRRLRAPPPLATLFEAESLFNDGTAIVVFLIALEAVFGPVSVAQGVAEFVVVSVGSVIVGLVAGFVVSIAMSRSEEHLVEITLSLFLAYGAYVAADLLNLSGIIATVTAGIVLGSFGRRYGLSQRARETIDDVWEFIAFLLTGLVFLLIGLAITIDHLLAVAVPIAWAGVAITVGRAIVVYGLLGGSFVVGERLGLGARLPLGWLHVIFWGGLRGAVAVALALSLPADLPQRELLQSLTFGVVLFTLLVQGTTASRLLRLAGVARPSGAAAPAE
jgi:CPA1 family monovalent cation:H+ antiporter